MWLLAMAAIGLAVGQTKPVRDPELIDAQGYQKILPDYKGEPLVVAFWATWCEPCRLFSTPRMGRRSGTLWAPATMIRTTRR